MLLFSYKDDAAYISNQRIQNNNQKNKNCVQPTSLHHFCFCDLFILQFLTKEITFSHLSKKRKKLKQETWIWITFFSVTNLRGEQIIKIVVAALPITWTNSQINWSQFWTPMSLFEVFWALGGLFSICI